MSLSPWFRFPDTSSKDQAENQTIFWQIYPVRYNQVRSIMTGMASCRNGTTNSLKPLWFQEKSVQAEVCRESPASGAALSVRKGHAISGGDQFSLRFRQCFSDKDFNYIFCWCLYLCGFLGLQNIFVPLRLILSFLCFWEKTSHSFKPCRAAVLVLQNPHLTPCFSFLNSSLSDLLFTYRPYGKHVGKACIQVHIQNKYFLWLFLWPAAIDYISHPQLCIIIQSFKYIFKTEYILRYRSTKYSSIGFLTPISYNFAIFTWDRKRYLSSVESI